MPFEFRRLAIPEVILVQSQQFADHRGFFMETYKQSQFAAHGIPDAFVQSNSSHSLGRVLRGLHYQKHPQAQGKLVMALHGEIFDVAVDIRKGSPTYGQWVGLVLSGGSGSMLYVPVGFAHGFCVLGDTADVLYMVTKEYAGDLDRGILWNDPEIGIEWPTSDPILSKKDAQLPPLREADNNFEYEIDPLAGTR
ncbi:MAG: dTDP-4-dehydrorhamnose 3,5-epimerase [Anaerolineae bacterium]|jgi:dTDP-4-dehydrorhamnose 3,5-epimerase